MPVPQRQMLEALKLHCSRTRQRFPKYGEALLKALADVVEIEGQPRSANTSPAQSVQHIVETLAEQVLKRKGDGEK